MLRLADPIRWAQAAVGSSARYRFMQVGVIIISAVIWLRVAARVQDQFFLLGLAAALAVVGIMLPLLCLRSMRALLSERPPAAAS